jgi:hypothetical protein
MQPPCKRDATRQRNPAAIDRIRRSHEGEKNMKPRHKLRLSLAGLLVLAASLVVAPAGAASAIADPTDAMLRNDRAHFRGEQPSTSAADHATSQSTSREAVVVRVAGGFDWTDAGVGAGGVLGLVLVLGAAASAIHRRRSDETAAEQSLAKGL